MRPFTMAERKGCFTAVASPRPHLASVRHCVTATFARGDAAHAYVPERLDRRWQQLALGVWISKECPRSVHTPRIHPTVIRQRERMPVTNRGTAHRNASQRLNAL